jgi:hypothetical protein
MHKNLFSASVRGRPVEFERARPTEAPDILMKAKAKTKSKELGEASFDSLGGFVI